MFVVDSLFASSTALVKAAVRVCLLSTLVGVLCASAPGQPRDQSSDYSDVGIPTEPVGFPMTGIVGANTIGNGVWWRPELNETSVTEVMQNLNQWGIENLYVDVFRSGRTLFPSKVMPQRENAEERDWLAYIIARAHERHIRVHAWIQTLRWHESDNSVTFTHPLLTLHPEWMDTTRDGFAFDGKSMARYVNPGDPEVRSLLLQMTHEICDYPIDGLSLDSIEYNYRADTGYTPQMVSEFENLYAADPTELTQDPDPDGDWMKWVAFREDKLTSVVQLMGAECRRCGESNGRRILLSVSVQPEYESTRGTNYRYQNWAQWLREDMVDATIPQCFTPDLPGLEKQLWEARSVHMGSRIPCIPGLKLDSTQSERHPSLREQHRLLRNTGYQHSNVMAYQGLLLDKEKRESHGVETHGGFWNFWKTRIEGKAR